MHKCKPKIQHLLIWSTDSELVARGRTHINTNFIEKFYAFTLEDLSLLIESYPEDQIELAIELYDFHVIKIKKDHFELVLIDNNRHRVEEIKDFEKALEYLIRKIPKLKH